MKRCMCLSMIGQCVMLLLLSKSSPALAAPIHMFIPSTSIVQTSALIPAEPAGQWHAPSNQYLGGHCISNRITRSFQGNNMSNSGNRRRNRGWNQDNSSNEGNQQINQGITSKGQGRNQYYQECVHIDIHLYYQGNNQGNSGNGGDNSGFNQDNSSNAGNQIVN